jgi:hypothetical protein
VQELTQGLDGLQRNLSGSFGAIQDDTGAVLVAVVSVVACSRDRVQVRPARVQGRVHVSHFPLHQLEVANRRVELLPVMGVLKRHVATGLHDPEILEWKQSRTPIYQVMFS